MIIKPDFGGRIFWGVAGLTLILTGCSMSALAFPLGLIILCIALPLAIFSFGLAFGVVQTRIDEDGIFQRNFFFMSKKFSWNEIESGKIETSSYNYKDSSGWTSRRTRTFACFTCKEKNIYINALNSGPENWWADMGKLAKEKLGDKFDS